MTSGKALLPPNPLPFPHPASRLLCNHSACVASWPNKLLALAEMFLRSVDAVSWDGGASGNPSQSCYWFHLFTSSLVEPRHDVQSVTNTKHYIRKWILMFGIENTGWFISLLYVCNVSFKLLVGKCFISLCLILLQTIKPKHILILLHQIWHSGWSALTVYGAFPVLLKLTAGIQGTAPAIGSNCRFSLLLKDT